MEKRGITDRHRLIGKIMEREEGLAGFKDDEARVKKLDTLCDHSLVRLNSI